MRQLISTVLEAVLYARVSSEEQEREGYSIPAQTKLLHEYADREEIKIVREFIDVGRGDHSHKDSNLGLSG